MPWIVAGNTVVYDSTSNCRPYLRVRAPPAHQPQALPRLHPQQRTHHRQQIRTGAVGGHPGDRVAGLLVGVGDPLQHRVQHRPARTTPLAVPAPAARWSPAPSCQPARPRQVRRCDGTRGRLPGKAVPRRCEPGWIGNARRQGRTPRLPTRVAPSGSSPDRLTLDSARSSDPRPDRRHSKREAAPAALRLPCARHVAPVHPRLQAPREGRDGDCSQASGAQPVGVGTPGDPVALGQGADPQPMTDWVARRKAWQDRRAFARLLARSSLALPRLYGW